MFTIYVNVTFELHILVKKKRLGIILIGRVVERTELMWLGKSINSITVEN